MTARDEGWGGGGNVRREMPGGCGGDMEHTSSCIFCERHFRRSPGFNGKVRPPYSASLGASVKERLPPTAACAAPTNLRG